MAIRDRIALLRAGGTTPSASSPWWVRATTSAGRPAVLASALIMSAPAEYHLARAAGFGRPYAYGMPLVLSSYAGIAAVVAASRTKGTPGRWSAILGAALALLLAMAAQIVGHLLTTGHMRADSWLLVAVVSAVPPLVVGHLLHLAAAPTSSAPAAAQDAPAPDRDAQEATPRPPVIPAGTRVLPTLTPCGLRPAPVPARTPAPVPQPAVPAAIRLLPTLTPCGTHPSQDAQDATARARFIGTAEVALLLGVDSSTVRNYVAKGLLTPAYKDTRGRNWFNPTDIGMPATA